MSATETIGVSIDAMPPRPGRLAIDAAREGGIEEAATLLEQAYELNRELRRPVLRGGHRLPICARARVYGQAEAAARTLATGERLYEQMGASPMAWLKRGNDEALALIRARLDDDAVLEAQAQGRALTADEAVTLALTALGWLSDSLGGGEPNV